MFRWIDKHYEKLTWMILLAGAILFFTARAYIGFSVTAYLIVSIVKERKAIRTRIKGTSARGKLYYLIGFMLLIGLIMLCFKAVALLNLPVWLLYITIFILLNAASIGYLTVMRKWTLRDRERED
ncbi:hypothetical protein [Paenibacillus sp. FJAT-26967]|uniref:hypothetical protein n=1 Tax=Paenibacillus sp. FJAT-26967 TaxID=1729690 RepID=UPI0012E381AA|nr:hypothetical protein [Paenibacillus sp. FJAT-26967]